MGIGASAFGRFREARSRAPRGLAACWSRLGCAAGRRSFAASSLLYPRPPSRSRPAAEGALSRARQPAAAAGIELAAPARAREQRGSCAGTRPARPRDGAAQSRRVGACRPCSRGIDVDRERLSVARAARVEAVPVRTHAETPVAGARHAVSEHARGRALSRRVPVADAHRSVRRRCLDAARLCESFRVYARLSPLGRHRAQPLSRRPLTPADRRRRSPRLIGGRCRRAFYERRCRQRLRQWPPRPRPLRPRLPPPRPRVRRGAFPGRFPSDTRLRHLRITRTSR